jgi:hypothetical protein
MGNANGAQLTQDHVCRAKELHAMLACGPNGNGADANSSAAGVRDISEARAPSKSDDRDWL